MTVWKGLNVMPCCIVILEDNADRQRLMAELLRDQETLAISLDHDLDLIESNDGAVIDPGSGRDVADFLAGRTPVCPVILHTTNSAAAIGMQVVLEEAGRTIRRVVPYGDLAWVGEVWIREVGNAIVSGVAARSAALT